MNIIISNQSSLPIYEQIKQQIKQQINSGHFKEGDMLPSIRQLASELRISVITTTRAYNDLEHDGYLYTVKGKGCFVKSQDNEKIKEEYTKKIKEHLSEAIKLAKMASINKETLIDFITKED